MQAGVATNGEPPFFVVGNDRSGTTLLRLVLDRSAEAAVPPESMFLVDFARVRRGGGLDDRARAARFAARVWWHPRVRAWGLPGGPPPVPRGLSHAEAYRFAVEAPFRAYARRDGKARFGDKTPPYLYALDELFAVWPEARVVVLVRDGRDVVLSIRRLPFGPNNAYAAARWWARGIRAGLEAEGRHPRQVLTVRFDDLVVDPETHVRRVCDHVGVGYDDDMLATERSAAEKLSDRPAWLEGLSRPISAAESGRWRAEMSEADRRVVEAVAGAELRRLGYETADCEQPVGAPRALAYTAHDAALRGVNTVRLRVVEERGRELHHVLRRKLAGARG